MTRKMIAGRASTVLMLCLQAWQASAQTTAQKPAPAPISWTSTFASAGDFNDAKIIALPDDGAMLMHHHRPHLLEPLAQGRLVRVDADGKTVWQKSLAGGAN